VKAQRGSLAVLFGGLFVVMVGFGVIIPVLPFYVLHFGATSVHLGLLMATYSTMQFIFAPVWGAVSDRIGRKPVLLLGLGGFVVSFTVFALATRLWMLFAARALAGVLSSATLPAAMAYIGDVTPEDQRGGGMGLLGAAMGLGMIFGPAIGGVFSRFGLQAPFAFSAALAAATLLAGVWLLPESLPGARGLGLRAVGAGGGPRPKTAPAPAPAPARRVSRWALASGSLALLFLLAFVVSFAIAGFESTFALYLNARLGTGSDQMGLIFTVMGAVAVVAQGLLVSRLIRRLGEDRVARLGLALTLAGMALTTRLGSLGSAILFASIFSLGNSLARPAVSSLVSRKTEVGQGAALGTMQSFDSLGRIAGPVWGGVAFRFYPGLPYWTGAAALGLALAASLVWAPLLAVPAAGGAEGIPR